MSVRLRLFKTGKTHQISYRIVAQDARAKRDGRFLEILGNWQPYIEGTRGLKIDRARVEYWVAKGAKPTQAVEKLLEQMDSAKRLTTNANSKTFSD